MTIDTRRVALRSLRFASLADARAEVERLAECERQARLRRLGNWTTGQIFGHLAWWIDAGFEGENERPAWWLRLTGRLFKRWIIRRLTRPGMRLPGVEHGTHGTAVLTLDEGLERFRRALSRLEAGTPAHPDPVLGRLTPEEWRSLHLRHCELHLGFLVPVESAAV